LIGIGKCSIFIVSDSLGFISFSLSDILIIDVLYLLNLILVIFVSHMRMTDGFNKAITYLLIHLLTNNPCLTLQKSCYMDLYPSDLTQRAKQVNILF